MTALVPDETRTIGGFRWSTIRECARQAVYQAQGAPERDRTRQEEGWLWRGKQLGRDFAIILAAAEKRKRKPYRIYVASGYRTEWPNRWRTPRRDQAAFIVEQPVRWPLGIMHPDIIVVETDTILEVLSSTHASDAMVASKMLQLVGQMEHSGAHGGAVVVVDPSNPLDYDLHPIARTSPVYADLAAEMRDRIAQVQAWAAAGTMPARVCAKPSDARSHFCRLADHCFHGWEPPDPDVLLASDEAVAAASRLYRAKQDEQAAKRRYDEVVAARREAEQRFEAFLPDNGAAGRVRAGILEVNRIVVSDRETFKLAKARTAGIWTGQDEERFRDYLSLGGGHVRYTIDRLSDEPLMGEAA